MPQLPRPQQAGIPPQPLTAAAYGVDQFLCVFGDQPVSGGRSNDLNVKAMLEEVPTPRASDASPVTVRSVSVSQVARPLSPTGSKKRRLPASFNLFIRH